MVIFVVAYFPLRRDVGGKKDNKIYMYTHILIQQETAYYLRLLFVVKYITLLQKLHRTYELILNAKKLVNT